MGCVVPCTPCLYDDMYVCVLASVSPDETDVLMKLLSTPRKRTQGACEP